MDKFITIFSAQFKPVNSHSNSGQMCYLRFDSPAERDSYIQQAHKEGLIHVRSYEMRMKASDYAGFLEAFDTH